MVSISCSRAEKFDQVFLARRCVSASTRVGSFSSQRFNVCTVRARPSSWNGRHTVPMDDDVRDVINTSKYVVLGGGGVYGFAYCGIIMAIQRHLGSDAWASFYENLKGCIGTSVGSLVALLVCVGVVGDRLVELISRHVPWSKINIGLNPRSLIENCGLESRAILLMIVQVCMEHAGLSIRTTFSDVQRLTKKHFVCCVTDLENSSAIFMDHNSHPNLSVAEAVVASMCVPILFEPCSIDGRVYVDGGLTQNVPLSFFPIDESLVIRLDPTDQPNVVLGSWRSYISAVMSCSIRYSEKTNYERLSERQKARFITIRQTSGSPDALDINSLNENVARLLINLGYMHATTLFDPRFEITVGRVVQIAFYVHSTMLDNLWTP